MVKTFLPAISLPGVPAKSVVPEPVKKEEEEVKYHDKIRLTDRLKVLKPDELGIVVKKLREVCPRAFRETEGSHAQIFID